MNVDDEIIQLDETSDFSDELEKKLYDHIGGNIKIKNPSYEDAIDEQH